MRFTAETIREMERESIRLFVQSCSEHFTGRVLDYGCGFQPYRGIVEAAGGSYVGYDAPSFPANVGTSDTTADAWGERFNTILCTQVVQYVPDVSRFLLDLRMRMPRASFLGGPIPIGTLVLTYPTSWEDFEEHDLWRFTKQGMTRLLVGAGFVIERHEARAQVELDGFAFRLGYGVVARA